MEKLFRLDGKVALVTGASRGLGLAIAQGLAQYGSDVVLVARDKNRLTAASEVVKKTGGRVWPMPFDLQEVEKIPQFFSDVCQVTGGVDILVNCAGTTYRAPAEELTLSQWQEVLNLNLTSVLVLCQAFARERIAKKQPGKIINIGSLMCEAARPTTAAYTAAKGGIRQLTKALAVDWASYQINVNAIGPGYFATELTRPLQEDEALNQWVKDNTPLKRWGQPEDLVGAAVFLASPASDFITGQIIYVDGGWLANL